MILMNFQKYISFKTKLKKYRNGFIHYFCNGNNYVHLHQKPYIIRFYQHNFLFVRHPMEKGRRGQAIKF